MSSKSDYYTITQQQNKERRLRNAVWEKPRRSYRGIVAVIILAVVAVCLLTLLP